MKHISGEQMLAFYYGDRDQDQVRHFSECLACQTEYQQMSKVLTEADDLPVPDRDEDYGAEVWRRLQPNLPLKRENRSRLAWMWLGPAFAAVAVAAIFLGVLTQRHAAFNAFSEQARTRVLLIAMSDHLERSQMVLAELLNADPKNGRLAEAQASARDLLVEDRLLRESAGRATSPQQASVLDQLERVLMDVANGPANLSQRDFEELQARIRGESLLLHVRMMGANARHKGRNL